MKTTITLPDAMFRKAKAATAMRGITLKSFVTDAVLHELERLGGADSAWKPIGLPLVPSRRPGSLMITGETLAEAINAEDANVSS